MKTVRFQYQTELAFSSPASEHRFLLRILPQSDDRQQIKNLLWQIDPSPVDTLWRTVDGFGNDALAGQINAPHGHFRFGIEGAAEVSGEPFVSSGEPPRILLYSTELTRPHRGLVDFYDGINGGINNNINNSIDDGIDSGVNNGIDDGIDKGINNGNDDDAFGLLRRFAPRNDGHCERSEAIQIERVKHFSHAVHEYLRYEPGATANSTSAAEAFDIGAGVCQDYAHILLALLRLDKIPCRYVAGLASDYGETHAWVEAWTGDRYCAVDPTRDKLIDEGYIALSRGRDFADSSIERGVFKGACRGTQTVSLNMVLSPN